MSKLVVMTAAHNEAKDIAEVLDRVPKRIVGIDQILKVVVDDGSQDQTSQIAAAHGAVVVRNSEQKRLAYSFQLAIKRALELEADYAVFIDADLQFAPEQIPDLLRNVIDGNADMVVGDRFTDPQTGKRRRPQGMPLGKYLANRLGTWVLSIVTRQGFRDVTCGFRAYNRKAMLSLNLNSKYTYTQEAFQVIAMQQLTIASFPIEVKYYPDRKSRVVTSFFSFLIGSGINILRTFRDNAPFLFFGWLGSFLFFFGLILDIFTLIHFLRTGGFSPYIFVAFTGVYFNTLGIVTWIVALLADMLGRMRSNQEKILYLLKEIRYGSDTKSD